MNLPTQAFKSVLTGEIQGGTTRKQLPNIVGGWVNIKAQSGNATNVYLGASNVTVPDGTTDTTSGFTLDAGEETGWLPLTNLNMFWMITDANGDDVTYIILR